jgi:hypothetical protein
MRGGAVFKDFLTSMDDVIDRAATMTEWAQHVDQLRRTRDALLAAPDALARAPADLRSRNQSLFATPLLEVAGDVIVAYFLLWSALVAGRKLSGTSGLNGGEAAGELPISSEERTHLAGKGPVARFFMSTMLPLADGKLTTIRWHDVSACTMELDSF